MKNAEQERGGSSGLLRWALFGAIAFIALLALIRVGFSCGYVDTLADSFGYEKTDGLSAGAHFVRDAALALLAFGGIGMAAWRNREMSRQADAARDQIENESKRIAGERFSDAVKMLAQNEGRKPAIAARIGGISVLQSLANNYISEYAAEVVKTLVAYVKVNAQLTKIPCKDSSRNFLGQDVKTAFAVLAQLLDERDESPEKKFELSDNDLDFSDCDFSRLRLDDRQVSGLRHYRWQRSDLRGSNLRGAIFREARMYGAQLQGANLCGANLEGAHLHNADLRGANLRMGSTDKELKRANLQGAKLYRADLRGAALSDTPFAFVDGHAADLSHADLNCVRWKDADLRGANLSGVKNLLSFPNLPELLSNRIGHSGQPELKEVKSIDMSSDREWDLKPYRNCPYALAGVLNNHNIIYGPGVSEIPSRGLLKAARKLLDDNDLPNGFSGIWRKRLEKVDRDGIRPDWQERNSLSHN